MKDKIIAWDKFIVALRAYEKANADYLKAKANGVNEDTLKGMAAEAITLFWQKNDALTEARKAYGYEN